jgi:TolB-like protein
MYIYRKFIMKLHCTPILFLLLLFFQLLCYHDSFAEEAASWNKPDKAHAVENASAEVEGLVNTSASTVSGRTAGIMGKGTDIAGEGAVGSVRPDKAGFKLASAKGMDTDDPVVAAAAEVSEIIADREENIRSLRTSRSYDIASDLIDPLAEPAWNRVAILPFENFSDTYNSFDMVMPELVTVLEEKGYDVVDQDKLNDFLCAHRVRETGYVSRNLARALRNRFGARAVMVGSVVLFSSTGEPQLGLISRLVDSSDGSILWADYSSAIGDDYTTILGLRRIRQIEKMVPRVVESLLDSFSIEPPYKDIESTYRLAVMPFQNNSGHRDAGMIASQLFMVALYKSEMFDPVEYGEVKKHVFDLRIRSKAGLDFRSIQDLREAIRVDGFVVGNVELYDEGELMKTPPKAAVTARLLDARDNRIVWYNRYHMSGDDDIIVLDWRKLMTVDRVADKIVSRLVDKMERIQWQ